MASIASSLRWFNPLDQLRRRFRASELWFIGLALLVGMVAGAFTVLQSTLAHLLQGRVFGLMAQARLSAVAHLGSVQLLMLPVGGLMLGLFTVIVGGRKRPLVDAVEANALHGGRLSMRDSLIVSVQTLLSNGFGASVGLEAAYVPMGSGAALLLGRGLHARRADMRTLVGAGAGVAHGDTATPDAPVSTLVTNVDRFVCSDWGVLEVMAAFDTAQTDELAVVDDAGLALGILTEAYVRKRYAEELEKSQRELYGER